MKTAKRQARQIALQALYAWQLSGGDPLEAARGIEEFDQADRRFIEALVRGVRDRVEELQGLIVPHLDRDLVRLSPVERSILYIGAFELVAHPQTDRKSTRLNSSHEWISYAVFCLKKKKKERERNKQLD